jgi:hypothetical protein
MQTVALMVAVTEKLMVDLSVKRLAERSVDQWVK